MITAVDISFFFDLQCLIWQCFYHRLRLFFCFFSLLQTLQLSPGNGNWVPLLCFRGWFPTFPTNLEYNNIAASPLTLCLCFPTTRELTPPPGDDMMDTPLCPLVQSSRACPCPVRGPHCEGPRAPPVTGAQGQEKHSDLWQSRRFFTCRCLAWPCISEQ